MNGRPWTRQEIDLLCQTVATCGSTIALGIALRRTHEAVIAKSKRLGLSFPSMETTEHVAAPSAPAIIPSTPA